MKRVAITGLGAVTPLGNDVKTFWSHLKNGDNGINRIKAFDPSRLSSQIAGEIKDFTPSLKIDAKLARRLDPFAAYALYAAIEAIEDSGLNFSSMKKEEIGVIVGSGMGGIQTWEREHIKFLEKGPMRVSPFLIPMMIPNIAAGIISIQYGLMGPNFATVSACASSAHAIGEALRHIRYGDAKVVITGGAEAAITEYAMGGFCVEKALSTRNDNPQKASRPFDRDRDGFVIGEGAGILVLEDMDFALSRGAKIYAELAGYGLSGDGYHITAPQPDGQGAVISMRKAINNAGLTINDIDYINAHGTSTKLNDAMETQAIKSLFKDRAYKIPVSSTKSMTGHLLGAAAAIETIATALSIHESTIHPTRNYENPDEGLDLDYVPQHYREQNINAAISNSLGFGGHNVTIALKKFKG